MTFATTLCQSPATGCPNGLANWVQSLAMLGLVDQDTAGNPFRFGKAAAPQ